MSDWQTVVFSSECDEDGNCPFCLIDYVEHREVHGEMQGRRL